MHKWKKIQIEIWIKTDKKLYKKELFLDLINNKTLLSEQNNW